jgi:hypothetical protein
MGPDLTLWYFRTRSGAGSFYLGAKVLSLLWLLFATVAAVIIARLVGCSNFRRSKTPVVCEVLKVWLILMLMMDGSLMGGASR